MQNIKSNYSVVRSGEAPRKCCAQISKSHAMTDPSVPKEEEQNQRAECADLGEMIQKQRGISANAAEAALRAAVRWDLAPSHDHEGVHRVKTMME